MLDKKRDKKQNDRKDKRVLVDVKDLNEEQLDAAIDEALDALFGKDEEEAARAEKAVRAGRKGSVRKAGK